MAHKIRALHTFDPLPDRFILRHALCTIVREVGERMDGTQSGGWEGQSFNGDHVWSRNDLDATGYVIQAIAQAFGQEGVKGDVTFEGEEISLISPRFNNSQRLRLIYDPIDGTKAFDNWKMGGDCPIPRPGSAVSIAAVRPVLGEILASAVYCFDQREVFSSMYLGNVREGGPQYAAFRNDTLLQPFSQNCHGEPRVEAKRRVLCGNYNSKALVDIARLELALMEQGLKVAYGGLTGSSATDIINVVRGSFCVCLDVRALCGSGGSVPYWYDVAGALPIAKARGLSVVVTNSEGMPLEGGNHDIYMPVAFVVARPEVETLVIEAIRTTVCPGFLREAALQAVAVG
jgi:fructose-1,6-bisphosphatase/inositol monophosphatase family enzyme